MKLSLFGFSLSPCRVLVWHAQAADVELAGYEAPNCPKVGRKKSHPAKCAWANSNCPRPRATRKMPNW